MLPHLCGRELCVSRGNFCPQSPSPFHLTGSVRALPTAVHCQDSWNTVTHYDLPPSSKPPPLSSTAHNHPSFHPSKSYLFLKPQLAGLTLSRTPPVCTFSPRKPYGTIFSTPRHYTWYIITLVLFFSMLSYLPQPD